MQLPNPPKGYNMMAKNMGLKGCEEMEGKVTMQRGELAQVIERFTMTDGMHETLIPGLCFFSGIPDI
ncbi:hypothetical protein HMSSN139_36010 [Paenibacillus sp. HMSSN-139]|nr:hypothetical protein HMSSN139_36010 [Paenibacillus sp. HMSSN-139]